MRLGDDLAAQTCLCNPEQLFRVVLGEVDLVADLVQLGHSNLASLVVTVCYPDGVDTLVDEVRCLFEECARQNYDTSGSVANLVVL